MKKTILPGQYASLGTRNYFNQTLKHIVSVTSLVESIQKGNNLATLLQDFLQQDTIDRMQILPIIAVVLREKLQASYSCRNIKKDLNDENELKKIAESCQRWNAVELVCIYHHPYVGVIPVNPCNLEHWQMLQGLKQNELMIIYAVSRKEQNDAAKKTIERKVIDACFDLLNGKKPAEDPAFIDTSSTPKQKPSPIPAPAPQQQPVVAQKGAIATPKPKGKVKIQLTPKYSVQVTNELFHNGNVEAWKNIIESYTVKHPECRIIVYHEGELIQDLNSLFKWGKVKHGGIILFQITGPLIKNVGRLQKYLTEGASSRFEVFMKHDVNKALQLF